jgi:hypothetical protein
VAPVDEQGPAQDLGQLRPLGTGQQRLGRLEPILGRLGAHLHLDELVVDERAVELPQHGLRHPLLPHLHHRRKMVTGGAKLAAQG